MATRFVRLLDELGQPHWINPRQVIRISRDSRTGLASLDLSDGSAMDTDLSVEEALRLLHG